MGSPSSDSSSHLPFSVSAPAPHPRLLLFLKQILDSTLFHLSVFPYAFLRDGDCQKVLKCFLEMRI